MQAKRGVFFTLMAGKGNIKETVRSTVDGHGLYVSGNLCCISLKVELFSKFTPRALQQKRPKHLQYSDNKTLPRKRRRRRRKIGKGQEKGKEVEGEEEEVVLRPFTFEQASTGAEPSTVQHLTVLQDNQNSVFTDVLSESHMFI